jgi:diguanylate cyclase (GGDEF)-like protein
VFCFDRLVGLPYVMVAKCLVVLLMTSIPAAIIYRDIERAYRTSFLEGALLGELVSRDALSGLMNRRAFDEHLTRVWQQALRDNRYVFIFMIDIDHFKTYNDRFGHQAGDLCLQSVAKIILEYAKRPLDFAARYGGEEFAMILYDLRRDQAVEIADEVRGRIRAVSKDCESQDMMHREVTVSIGIAGTVPSLGRSPLGLVQLADQGLYEAKDAGRDRTVCKSASDYSILETGAFEIFKPKTLRAL